MVEHIFVVPGNAGTGSGLIKVSNHIETAANDFPNLVLLAKLLRIGLVVAGPDDAVVDGIEGGFRESQGRPFIILLNAPANRLMQVEFLALLLRKRPRSLKAQRLSLRTSCGDMGSQRPTNKMSASTSLRRITLLLYPIHSSLKYPV